VHLSQIVRAGQFSNGVRSIARMAVAVLKEMSMRRHVVLALTALSFACGSSDGGSRDDAGVVGGSGGTGGTGGTGAGATTGTGGTMTGSGGSIIITPDSGGPIADTGGPAFGDGGLPPGFTMTDKGGYKLGDPIPPSGTVDAGPPGGGTTRCNSTLIGVVRDMKDTHRDFERLCCGDTRGAVAPMLGADQKPVYAGTGPTNGTNNGSELMSGPAEFVEWYRDVDGINSPYLIYFFFVPGNGVYTFHSSSFFPLDGKGWGNQSREHNFHFTTELHTRFQYRGGETFHFTGDDDVWVFINGRLAIDLGGVHSAADAQVSLDARSAEFGIEIGKAYPLDLFQAERHTNESNFRIETNLDFVNCGTIVPK
jgi:fibro-slime domain-containing protein